MGGVRDGGRKGLVGRRFGPTRPPARSPNRRTARRARDACLDSATTHRELAKGGIVSHLEQQHLEITVVGI
jgi:hypothetical protein